MAQALLCAVYHLRRSEEFILNMIISAATGILSGWGVGGGTLLLIILTAILNVDSVSARTINLLYFFPTSLGALIFHIKNKLIPKRAFLLCTLAGVPMAVLFAFLSFTLSTGIMQKLFGSYLIIIGIREFIKKDDR